MWCLFKTPVKLDQWVRKTLMILWKEIYSVWENKKDEIWRLRLNNHLFVYDQEQKPISSISTDWRTIFLRKKCWFKKVFFSYFPLLIHATKTQKTDNYILINMHHKNPSLLCVILKLGYTFKLTFSDWWKTKFSSSDLHFFFHFIWMFFHSMRSRYKKCSLLHTKRVLSVCV